MAVGSQATTLKYLTSLNACLPASLPKLPPPSSSDLICFQRPNTRQAFLISNTCQIFNPAQRHQGDAGLGGYAATAKAAPAAAAAVRAGNRFAELLQYWGGDDAAHLVTHEQKDEAMMMAATKKERKEDEEQRERK